MKKLTLAFSIITIIITSCVTTNKVISLKGNYPQTPITFKSDAKFDQVWDRLVDLFAQKGLSIKIIDKNSGLIVSDKSILSTTVENKNGGLQDSSAFIVVPKIYQRTAQRYVPITKINAGPYVSKNHIDNVDPIYGDWNVRIKALDSGTIINVNIINLYYDIVDKNVIRQNPLHNYKTTGVFEKTIFELIK